MKQQEISRILFEISFVSKTNEHFVRLSRTKMVVYLLKSVLKLFQYHFKTLIGCMHKQCSQIDSHHIQFCILVYSATIFYGLLLQGT